jgi:mxaJ protein
MCSHFPSGLYPLNQYRLSGGASRLTALLLAQILRVFSVVAPCHPVAALRNPVPIQRIRATRLALAAACSVTLACAGAEPAAPAAPSRVLRVCADPNNLPFSNDRRQGFENRLAELVAARLGAHVEYEWWAQRRGFVRNTLRAGLCDAIMGVPSSFELAATTRPYYRSTYVFVTRAGEPIPESFDDPLLRERTVGVHLIGDDFANSPPAHALSARGIIRNVRGYSVYGDYRSPNPPAALVNAVADRTIDLAVAWGPLAGYFARRAATPLQSTPVSPEIDLPFLPFVFDMSMAVDRGNDALLAELDQVIVSERAAIDALLAEYGVPRADRRPRRAALEAPPR